jgi:photosystem II stability/assembly factor-like uncharacterized protein
MYTSSISRRAARSVVVSQTATSRVQELRVTSDAGCSWKTDNVLPDDPDETFRSMHFLNSDLGWIGGSSNGSLYRTTDGGVTWTALTVPYRHRRVIGLHFASWKTGWVIALNDDYDDKQIYVTSDAGLTWNPHQHTGSVAPPFAWKSGYLLHVLSRTEQ